MITINLLTITKICRKCKNELPLSFFSKKKNGKYGLRSRCKECELKANQYYDEKNKARENFIVSEFKTCPGCKTEKLSAAFSKAKRIKDGLRSWCKECEAVRVMESRYGLSPEQYNAMLKAQGGACAICKWIPGPEDGPLDTDHIHGTDIIRGLLHRMCNRGLGLFKDDIAVIRKAIEYLSGPTTGIVYKKRLAKSIREPLLASQNGLCKICSIDLTNKKACTDHDHLTNMIRGILCQGCNCGLGQFKDSVKLLQLAVGYLEIYSLAKAA